MRILYLDIPAFFANRDMIEALEHYTDESGAKLDIVKYHFIYDESKVISNESFEENFIARIRSHSPDFVFSFNFLPVVSKVCNIDGIPYVSWIYDNPELYLYSYQVINPCNIVLLFDSKQCEEFIRSGIKTVDYLPLAASTRRLDTMKPDMRTVDKYTCDISFVGSLYTERKQYYEEMVPNLDQYTLGYLEGLIRSQLHVDGINFIEECLTPEIVDGIKRASNIHTPSYSAETVEHLYANYVLNRQATIIERKELLTLIGQHHPVRLYTYTRNQKFSPHGVHNMGPADYFLEMPYIFKLSKINLNITLRSIKNGIPLRAFDILGSGGFLLSNYQVDLARHFVPGEDYVYYESRKDLLDKIDYYLKHDDERMAIVNSAHNKILNEHTFDIRISQIIDIVKSKKCI